MFNFRDISRLFLENEAGVMVHNASDLAVKVKGILSSQLLAKQMVERAYALIMGNKGATKRNIEAVKQLLH
jgi:3-deoxy-D-manno-octulosonic-acid transferase